MRVAYKVFPLDHSTPNSLGRSESWMPTLPVKIVIGHTHSKFFEAIVDSGADTCLFHSSIGEACGLKLKDGIEGTLGGVIGGTYRAVHYHKIKLMVAGTMIPITAGFSPDLSVAGLLGRFGFFEHYAVNFDPSNSPPGFEITRIHRA